ncbi:MAG: protease inhibitor I42 family protein [Halobacteriota archaeon]|nr:protease inhibitor I42 family protein [Halobacteriota archaeon]
MKLNHTILVLVIVLVGTSGCLSSDLEETVYVDASSAGKEVELSLGDTLVITLNSNPTTGFRWNLTEMSDGSVLRLSGNEFEPPEASDPPLVGAGGREVWTFNAIKAGSSIISMEYSRPWEEETEPAETFNLTIVVK